MSATANTADSSSPSVVEDEDFNIASTAPIDAREPQLRDVYARGNNEAFVMSHADGTVFSLDGKTKLGHFIFDGTSSVATTAMTETLTEAWQNRRTPAAYRECTCKAEPTPCILSADYGSGFEWESKVCLMCKAIVGVTRIASIVIENLVETRGGGMNEETMSRDKTPSPLRIGDLLQGYCGGYFGRDSYDDKRVEGIGSDWVVAREEGGNPVFHRGRPEDLIVYRDGVPAPWEDD